MHFTNTALLFSSISLSVALNPNCAPGGNFDLSHWTLQLPSGTPGHPTEIRAGQLGSDCHGYTNARYFFTDKADGALVMTVPGDKSNSDCVSTPNSDHCRCELRESQPSSWDPRADRNRLFGDLKVTKNTGEICVGQIHVDDSVSHKPVAELYYNAAGDLKMGVQLCADNSCKQQRVDVDHVPRGQRFTYEIRYEKNVLEVSINGKALQKLDTHKLNAPKSYFKAGNYNQGSGPTEVHFYQIKVSH
ncbi:alginate lyase [Cordyceps fumosorosea ARSEF 2679]|uniref:Alginate lyase n=1 Tax=Cordyceps fumosorosea (strain ARSEF 2679) TaxID=1081104 RepID=A0A167SBH3_CORFA|nr:alginate lyase [Cordyceps fumosorosea ARSEF 2679]OAA59453.1 alginate lyase [Cordyceps fumosorosea ARSEF 2679]